MKFVYRQSFLALKLWTFVRSGSGGGGRIQLEGDHDYETKLTIERCCNNETAGRRLRVTWKKNNNKNRERSRLWHLKIADDQWALIFYWPDCQIGPGFWCHSSRMQQQQLLLLYSLHTTRLGWKPKLLGLLLKFAPSWRAILTSW